MTADTARARIVSRRTEGRSPIFDAISSAPLDDRYETGATPGEGTFFCLACGSQLSMQETDELPDCPRCGGSEYRRDSIFESRQDHGDRPASSPPQARHAPPSWLEQAREQASGSGYCLACQSDDGEIVSFPIEHGWTRIGRSANADLRLDDPSVSRRHALIVAETPTSRCGCSTTAASTASSSTARRSSSGRCSDGDELAIGRYRLFVLKLSRALTRPGFRPPPSLGLARR